MTLAFVLQGLTGRTDIAIGFRFVTETLGTEEWTSLFSGMLSRVRVQEVMLRSANHFKNSPFP
jgi:hypothetical protein